MAIKGNHLDVAGCGSMVVDLIYRSARIAGVDEKSLLFPHPGKSELVQHLTGGVTLNHLGWATVLGLKTGVFGKIGNDDNGGFLERAMETYGIERHLTRDGSASAFANIFVGADGGRAIYMCRGATGELTADEIRTRHGAFIRRARIVTTEISQLQLKTVIAILLYARTHSIPTVLDIDVPPSDACATLGNERDLDRAIRLATILKPTKAAAEELVGRGDLVALATKLRRKFGSEAVTITDGPRGCAIATDETSFRVAAFKIRALDSTGAGDAFLGGMLAGLKRGLPWRDIGRLANAAGAVCVAQLGAFPNDLRCGKRVLRLAGMSELPSAREKNSRVEQPNDSSANLTRELNQFLDVCLEEMGSLRRKLNLPSLFDAVSMIREAESRGGRVHVTGAGKPEHIARYVASLLSSVGTMSTFLHATETLHGSLGQVHKHDVVIAISNSGETKEVCAAARAIKEHGARVIAVTNRLNSDLSRCADLVLHTPVEREGGPLGLAPRASILGQVYVLCALSVALEAARGLTLEEYSRWHQAGALGDAARRLAAKQPVVRRIRAV